MRAKTSLTGKPFIGVLTNTRRDGRCPDPYIYIYISIIHYNIS